MLLEWLGKLTYLQDPLRPPGAVEEDEFLQRCIRCRKCEEVCPYYSIKSAHGEWGLKMGTPFISPRDIPCYLCDDFPCIDSCPTNALEPVESKEDIRMGIAVIDKTLCFAYNGIMCRACFDRCPIYREAITLEQELYPVVHEDKCVGCGICEHVCPTEQTSITMLSSHKVIS
ncbi:MAG: 4Fe-4S binding protein [Candidatus Marinimicrobia bacterium]|nr:4Fe-4S binding protein [Candidatus Neomarinimicrobiota bacterium]